MWEDYVEGVVTSPTDADRKRLERAGGGELPDGFWKLVGRRQGQVLKDGSIIVPGQGDLEFGVLLLALAPASAGDNASYCIERCLENMRGYYPEGILPFGDDTGGNYWAFDFRKDPHVPSIVFIDHEVAGGEGLTPVAPNFETFATMLPGFVEAS